MMSASAPPVEDPSIPIPMLQTPILPQSNDISFPHYPIINNHSLPEEDNIKYIDFKIKKSTLNAHFNSWKRSLWFPPQSFIEVATIIEISPILVPYWLLSTQSIILIKAQVLEADNEWKVIEDQKSSYFENLFFLGAPVDVPHYDILSDSAQYWNPSILLQQENVRKSWFPKLPHTGTKSLDIDQRCRQKIEELEIESTKPYLTKQGYHSISDVSVKVIDLQNISKTLIYLPLYVCLYQYHNYFYTVMINGFNGATTGERPYNTLVEIVQSISGVSGFGSFLKWYSK
jgi:hypothetical protein